MVRPNAPAASRRQTQLQRANRPLNSHISQSTRDMSDLARLPSYPSPTTLIARSGIQFLDFGFDPVRLRVREWGFHDTASGQGCR